MRKSKTSIAIFSCNNNNNNNNNNNMKNNEIRRILSQKKGVNKVKITRNGEVHLHATWPRGDNGAAPWWVYIGKIDDIRREMMGEF